MNAQPATERATAWRGIAVGGLRARPDLILAAHGQGDRRYWVVEDPVALEFFRLRDEECLVLRLLDGRTALDQIREQFERRFAPLRLGARQLHAFLFHLHELGLIVADVPGQGAVLGQRRQAARQKEIVATLTNPLAIRLPGLSAAPIVEWLYPRCRWMFGPVFLVACALLVMAAVGLIAIQFETFQARLPSFWTFFDLRTTALFAATLVAIKALHELGHALTCRHFGGRCREFGVLLLVFMPTLYCDVSDAWRLPNKWQRILVSSAGMLVELVLAALATFVWWFSEPGLLNAVCLRVMFVCSIGTLLFNLNPLLRCDGYFILSDLVEVPNLWQESRALWQRTWLNWLGLNTADDRTVACRLRGMLMAYAAASALYCWLLVAAILWFCFRMLEPHGLAPLALVLAAIVLVPMSVLPLVRTFRRLNVPGGMRRIRRGRAAFSLVLMLAALAFIALVPVPHRVAVPMWLEARDAQPVYVPVAGTLQEVALPGTPVKAGQKLATIVNPEVELQVAKAASDVRLHELQLQHLKLMQADDRTAQPLIPAAEKSLADAQQRLQQWQRDQERLVLRAPADGIVLPPPAVAPPPEKGVIRLAGWQGTPLQPHNRGCYLETGALVCLVGDPQRLEAMLIVEQAEVSAVRVGQHVRLRIEQSPAIVLTGTIVELAKTDAGELPNSLALALDLPQTNSNTNGPRTAATYYQVRAELDAHDAPLLVGMQGNAKILADWQPLAYHVWRYLQRTFTIHS